MQRNYFTGLMVLFCLGGILFGQEGAPADLLLLNGQIHTMAADRHKVQALAGYTTGGAYLTFREKDMGSLEVGKYADLIVLDRNLFDLPPTEIHQTKVLLTLLEGREVHRDTTFKKDQ